MVKTYFILLIAIFCEVAGTMLLPVTQNFSKVIPTLGLTIFYLVSFYLMTFVMDKLPIAIVIKRLPKTRSGKILRGTIRKIADNVEYKIPPTIDDPAILDEIKQDLINNKILING